MRFYGFSAAEVAGAAGADGMLPLDIDPKLAWALKHRETFPVDVNRAPREALLRIPGLGVKAADRLLAPRPRRRPRLDRRARPPPPPTRPPPPPPPAAGAASDSTTSPASPSR